MMTVSAKPRDGANFLYLFNLIQQPCETCILVIFSHGAPIVRQVGPASAPPGAIPSFSLFVKGDSQTPVRYFPLTARPVILCLRCTRALIHHPQSQPHILRDDCAHLLPCGPCHCGPCLCSPRRNRASLANPASQPKLGSWSHTACPAGPVSAPPGALGHHLPTPLRSPSLGTGHTPLALRALSLLPQADQGITCHPAAQPKLGEWALTSCPGGLVSAPPGAPGSQAGPCC